MSLQVDKQVVDAFARERPPLRSMKEDGVVAEVSGDFRNPAIDAPAQPRAAEAFGIQQSIVEASGSGGTSIGNPRT